MICADRLATIFQRSAVRAVRRAAEQLPGVLTYKLAVGLQRVNCGYEEQATRVPIVFNWCAANTRIVKDLAIYRDQPCMKATVKHS
ncbi:hypothetical protein RRG08_020416 [Elysia crispata]|uniref:Uncharacterized protein n=1 Tax=Elysia crispata TaxID=231223 RepID=A0AAE1E9V5_9GAST|nr:hypothetical protein RRG08_020416 [Elysia crispata]